MRGPTSVLASSPGPRRSRSARSHTILTSLSCTRSCTTRRLVAVQRWPVVPNAPQRAFEGEVQVRVLHDEHRVLAAHLERSEEHTSELQSPFLISYAVFCLKKKKK